MLPFRHVWHVGIGSVRDCSAVALAAVHDTSSEVVTLSASADFSRFVNQFLADKPAGEMLTCSDRFRKALTRSARFPDAAAAGNPGQANQVVQLPVSSLRDGASWLCFWLSLDAAE
ncbi:hypothetical protein quinque_016489 [Culex quinquefasciatus]